MVETRQIQETKNIASYVKEEKRTFSEKPITDVDLLVFSALAYLELETYPEIFGGELNGNTRENNGLPLALKDLPDALPGEKDISSLLEKDSDKRRSLVLLKEVLNSPRFSSVEIIYFECKMTEIPLSSFAGTLFHIPENASLVLAFRGTDVTPEGWLDSNRMLSFETTPGIRRATAMLDDLMEIMADFKNYPLYVCGHSKGGTLAEHALLMCSRRGAQRVVRSVSFDGPALFCLDNKGVPECEEFDLSLLHRYKMGRPIVRYTFSSLIGLTLERRNPYQFPCIASIDGKPRHGFNFALVEDGEFVLIEPSRESVSEALFISRLFPLLNEEERHFSSNLLYEACKMTGIAADLSSRFIKEFFACWEENISKLSGRDQEMAQEIWKKVLLAENITLPFEE